MSVLGAWTLKGCLHGASQGPRTFAGGPPMTFAEAPEDGGAGGNPLAAVPVPFLRPIPASHPSM